jgi:hypothetical protein
MVITEEKDRNIVAHGLIAFQQQKIYVPMCLNREYDKCVLPINGR